MMATTSNQLTTVATARPLRVAYLIDTGDCPDALLDAIFSEAYGRWGGRRTLIVPAKPDGIDSAYRDWLLHYDADVIYSFVALADSAVADIHERYCPAHLEYHKPIGKTKGDERYFRIELPIRGLRSLSVVPAMQTRTWGIGERMTDVRVIDRFFDRSESAFISENFGFLSDTYHPLLAQSHPDLFGTITLITQKSADNPAYAKSPTSEYLTDEGQILSELGKPRQILPLSVASDLFTPYLVTDYSAWSSGLTLVVGDSVDDRLLFWNQHQRQEETWLGAITALRLPAARLTDVHFLTLIKKIILRRGKPNAQGRHSVTVRSCSLSQAELDGFAGTLRGDFWAAICTARHESHAACIPTFDQQHFPHYRYNISLPELRTRESLDFRDSQTHVPNAEPWHMREAAPPANLRDGNWMVDLAIDRLNDHCRYASGRHPWVLPRRLRLDRSFKVNWADESPQHYGERVIRVPHSGYLSLPKSHGRPPVSITTPDDIDAFRNALCARTEWLPFEPGKQEPSQGRKRYAYAEPSDKGRYLLAVLEHFDNLPDAFGVLMHRFWRDMLIDLGAVPAEKNPALITELTATLRKRLGRATGGLQFDTAEDIHRLARESIRFGRKAGREARFVRYGVLRDKWLALAEAGLETATHLTDEEKDLYRDPRDLDRSIQHLCQRKILFQGREWQCRRCYNRNWVSIDTMRGILECEVCKQPESAPVSGDWQFRASNFVLDAYREHGVEAVVWTLWRLWQIARRSFYFAPSMRLWENYPEKNMDGPTIEIDALVVIDGTLYLCEAKTSPGLNRSQIEQLHAAASRIRPEVLLVSCMEPPTPTLRAAVADLQTRLGDDIKVDLVEFQTETLEDHSILPG